MAILRLQHTGVLVQNIERSAAWYEKVLGLRLNTVLPDSDPSVRLGFLGFANEEGFVIELIEGFKSNPPNEGVVHHLAFAVDDIEKEELRLRELGVTFLNAGIATLQNGIRSIFFEGPDGEHLELYQEA